jgi:hypothetical protein
VRGKTQRNELHEEAHLWSNAPCVSSSALSRSHGGVDLILIQPIGLPMLSFSHGARGRRRRTPMEMDKNPVSA